MDEQNKRSEELFETLQKNKKKRRQKVIRTVLIAIAVIALIFVLGVQYLRAQVQERFASAAADVKSYAVTTGTLHTVVSGSGTLTQVDLEQISVPEGVIIMEVHVENRDVVKAGDLLATVDMASVMTAMANVQDQLNALDKDIAAAKDDTVSSTIRAGVTGRVKRVFAAAGTDITSCMAENGALAILSLDGYMAVEIETSLLTKNETVTVILADGSEVGGTVKSVVNGKAVVLVTDDGPAYDEQVTVFTFDGKEAGTGNLYIHNPLAITGYAGTVSSVSVKENAKVYANTTVFRLTNTSFSANYDTLLRNREELEETLMELLTIYRDGAVLAPMDGIVSAVQFDEDGEDTQTDILSLFPNKSMCITISVDETDILALKEGQEAEVVVSSVSEEVLVGEVTEISKEATTSSGVTTYSAEITVDILDGMLPGMTADVDVKIQGVEGALIIPVDALHQTSAIYYVYTSYDAETQLYGGMVEVTIGMQNDDYVEILSGLKEGDVIYYIEDVPGWFFGMMGGGSGNRGGSSQRPDAGGNKGQGGQR
ncbi:MAG: HlyD family efflux transporter periplasmic adaptor subunit [Oscillospiraceae bacterium]|nr:HlyD family efflux transporter periplasmic adaptor subunit [Oscillospiraceae bacterium]